MNPHEALIKELGLEKDLEIYMRGGQFSFPITPKLAASVARWPVATEEFDVYRGQPKPKDKKSPTKYLPLPLMTPYDRRPFFSTSMSIAVAKTFAGYATPTGDTFKITVKPGVRYLKLSSMGEAEILVAADGVAEYGPEKVRVTGDYTWTMSWPVTYSPKPSGGRRKTRRAARR
jgi:hypothetical protein